MINVKEMEKMKNILRGHQRIEVAGISAVHPPLYQIVNVKVLMDTTFAGVFLVIVGVAAVHTFQEYHLCYLFVIHVSDYEIS